jgi:hypothetical protein
VEPLDIQEKVVKREHKVIQERLGQLELKVYREKEDLKESVVILEKEALLVILDKGGKMVLVE